MSRLSGTSNACLSIAAKFLHRTIAGIRNGRRLPGMGRRKLCRITTAIGLWALSLGPAYAALVYDTPIVSFNDSVSVTDVEGGGSTSNDNTALWTSFLDQFDTSIGVLTGVTINIDSTRTQSVTVSSTKGDNGNGSVISSGSGSSTAAISAPGVSYTFSTPITADGKCTGNIKNACGPRKTTTAGIATIQDLTATDSLDSYVGGGTVTVSRTAPTLSAEQLNDVFSGTETTQYDLTWAGDLSATYSYLLHAAPSFDSSASVDSLTLDFGTVDQNSSVSLLGFSIFNLADLNRTNLDLVSFTATGDTSALDSGLTTFANLLQGADQLFYATLDTSNVGVFSATYTLTLADAANIGAASSQYTYTLYLTLTGNVTAVSSVPVPDAAWLFGSGLIGLTGISRRKTP